MFDNFEVKEFDWLKVYKRTQEKAHGSDFGFTHDPTTLISTVVDIKNKELWIYDEHYEKGMLTDEIYQMYVDKGYKDALIVADSAEKRLIAEIKRKGILTLNHQLKVKVQSCKVFSSYKVSRYMYIQLVCIRLKN